MLGAGAWAWGHCAALCPAWELSSSTPTCSAGESGWVPVPPSGQGQTCLSSETNLAASCAPLPGLTSSYLAPSFSERQAGTCARGGRERGQQVGPQGVPVPPSLDPLAAKDWFGVRLYAVWASLVSL